MSLSLEVDPGDFAGSVPIIFGVTGHKDVVIDDHQFVADEVARVLRSYQHQFPNSPIILASPLAEGADQIVARAALDVGGVRLAAVLPMPVEAYLEDFEGQHAKKEFEKLLSKAAWVHVTGCDLSNRNRLYETCGRYVASLSHVLIAVWNGNDNKKQGGTAATLKFKLDGCMDFRNALSGPDDRFLSRNETGIVLSVLVRRTSEPETDPPRRIEWQSNEYLGGSEGVIKTSKRRDYDDVIASLIERYNSDAKTERAKEGSAKIGMQGYVDEFYRITNSLALKYQRRSRCVIQLLFLLGIAAIMSSQINQNVHTNLTLLLELSAIAMMWALWLLASRYKLKEKHEEYRSLAEAARIQGVWQDCGLDVYVADSYLSAQIGELDWLRRSIRSVQVLDVWSGKITTSPSAAIIHHAASDWMRGQHNYYAGKSKVDIGKIAKLTKNGLRLAKYAKIFLAAGVAFVLLRFPYLTETVPKSWLTSAIFNTVMILSPYLAPLSLALAASLKAYGELMGYSTISRRYKSMALVLQRGLEMLEHVATSTMIDKSQSLQKLALHVGREALVENGDWIISRRQRDLQPVT